MDKSEDPTITSDKPSPEKSILSPPTADSEPLGHAPSSPISFDIESVDDGSAPTRLTKADGTAIARTRGKKGIDWELAKRVYVETEMSQSEIAHLIGVSMSGVALHSMKDKWTLARKARLKDDLELGGEKRKALRDALERSSKTQEVTAQLALASLTIIAEELKEWHERKRAFLKEHPGDRFPQKMPLTPAGINALTSSMQRMEQWDRAKLGGPDVRMDINVKKLDLTAVLDRANVVG